jgi:hypothetical protein
MSGPGQLGKKQAESGAALLIAIFALLLISVVAIALVVTSGTDAALGGNYRTSTAAYFAGVAGLEEARGRLLWKNPDYINNNKPNSFPTLMRPDGLPTWQLTDVFYITNPAPGETVDPLSANPADYPDTEYQTEFGWPLAGATVNKIASVSAVAGLPGPSYKWVRITPATEKSLAMDVDGDGLPPDLTTKLYYDPANSVLGKPSPGLIAPVPPTPVPATAVQVLEITSLAVLPGGSRRLLQYVVAPVVISPYVPTNPPNPNYAEFANPPGNNQPSFPAALTILGNNPTLQVPSASSYVIDGRDSCSATTPKASVNSIGYTDSTAYPMILGQLNPQKSNYPGYPMAASPGPPPVVYTPTTPSIPPNATAPPSAAVVSSVPLSWQNPAMLDALVQDINNSADVVINKSTANGSDISSRAAAMSVSNPMTIVINGDLDLTGWHNVGYGLLLITGALRYDPDASWNGIVLVIGQGIFSSSKSGTGGIQGAVVVAKTRDTAGNLLPTALGPAFFGSQTSYGSNPGFGIVYGSCYGQTVQGTSVFSAQGPLTYKVLSFHEIPLTN